MAQIAYISDTGVVYRPAVILLLTAAGTVLLFLGLRLRTKEAPAGAFFTALTAVALSLYGGRLVHWYCFPGNYSSFSEAMVLTDGGFALVGAFGGCLLAAVVTRLLCIQKNLPAMVDSMSIAGAAGISVGRLASLFDTSDRGQLLTDVQSMPWAYPVVNSVSGATEYRLATFLLQAIACGVIFLVLTLFCMGVRRRWRRDGDVALLFMLLYGASQILLDSTRYDSLYFRSNGFVSIVQVLSALMLGLAILIISIRAVREKGFHGWYLPLWIIQTAMIGGAGYMEYHVQRHGSQAQYAYSVMGLCLAGVVDIAVLLWIYGHWKNEKI